MRAQNGGEESAADFGKQEFFKSKQKFQIRFLMESDQTFGRKYHQNKKSYGDSSARNSPLYP